MPLWLICLAALCAFVALAIDIGRIALARTQCQSAADAAATAGARALDGSPSGNTLHATERALTTAIANEVLSELIDASEVAVEHGTYHYDYDRETFTPQFPPVPPDNYNLTQITITHSVSTTFAWIFGIPAVKVSANACAAHRPRDVCLLVDFSGALNNESNLWNTDPALGAYANTSNHCDSSFPRFGWYDPSYSPQAQLQCSGDSGGTGRCNITQPVSDLPPLVNDFFQNERGAGIPTAAFYPAPDALATHPLGDSPAVKLDSDVPARTWEEITGAEDFDFLGYEVLNGAFHGWMQGPGYWGKTFFLWPPDPTTDEKGNPHDWRKRFFFLADGVTPNNDNTHLPLAGADGSYPDPPGHYGINYRAILAWIRAHCMQQQPADGNPFPPRLRAGNILYYDEVPEDVPASAYNHSNPNSQITDASQRFWKEYIDYVLGVWRDPDGVVHHAGTAGCSMGPDFPCGTTTGKAAAQLTGPDGKEGTWMASDKGEHVPYINPTDNPLRPRHRFWFGPLTLIQFLLDTGMLPGTAHDLGAYSTRLALAAALLQTQMTHPNDLVSVLFFSRPMCAGDADGVFNLPQHSLSRDYTSLLHSLWFPSGSSTADIRPWGPAARQWPRVHGDYGPDRATGQALKLAYNQFSGNAGLRSLQVSSQRAGGLGRLDAQRLVILLSSGMPGMSANPVPPLTNNGPGHCYYNILPGQALNAGPGSMEDVLQTAQAICNKSDGTALGHSRLAGYPGYGTASKPVLIHTLAFGPSFEKDQPEQAGAITLLQQVSRIGGTVFPSSPADPVNGYKWCVGPPAQRQARLQNALTTILNDEVSVVLVR